MDDDRRQILIEYRIKLVELEINQIGLFDKTTLAISSGAFGLSIIFLEKFLGIGSEHETKYLILSWVLLLATIFINLISYLPRV